MTHGIGNHLACFSPEFLSGRASSMSKAPKIFLKLILNTTYDPISKPIHHLVSHNTQS